MKNKIDIRTLSNEYIILLALYKEAGEDGLADVEDIAVSADKLVKKKFRWKKYKKYIDLSLVKSLLANSRERVKLVNGGKNGWYLTKKGMKIIDELKDKISYTGQRLERLSKFDKNKIIFESNRILSSNIYLKYSNDEKITISEIKKIYKIDKYASEIEKRKAISNLIRLLKDNEEINNFLKTIKKRILKNE
jgi:hypothetical protein